MCASHGAQRMACAVWHGPRTAVATDVGQGDEELQDPPPPHGLLHPHGR